MPIFKSTNYKIYSKFLSTLASKLTKFYYSKLNKPFEVLNKLKGRGGYDVKDVLLLEVGTTVKYTQELRENSKEVFANKIQLVPMEERFYDTVTDEPRYERCGVRYLCVGKDKSEDRIKLSKEQRIELGKYLVRAFADDTGMTTRELWRDLNEAFKGQSL